MKLSDTMFDVLSFIGKIVLPSLATLVVTLGDVWGLSYVNEISQTIIALDVFLNALLGITSVNYYKEIAETEDEVANEGSGVEE